MKCVLFSLFLLCPLSLPAAVIFSDDFSGSAGTALNGLAPDTRPGAEVWKSTLIDANGQVTNSTSVSAWLPFSFSNNQVYTLSTTVDITYTSASTTFAGLAFTQDSPLSTSSVLSATSNDYGVLQVRRGGGWAFFEGPVNNGAAYASGANNSLFTTSQDNYEIKLVLTTSSSSSWTLAGYLNGVQYDLNPGDPGSLLYSFASTPNFTGVGINYSSSTLNFESVNFSSAVPEPSICGLFLAGALTLFRRRGRI